MELTGNGYLNGCMENYRKKKVIIIFGCGNYGRILGEYLVKNKISSFVGFCDNSKEKIGTKIMGNKKVFSLEEVLTEYPSAYFVVTPKYGHDDIITQLISNGVLCDNIELFVTPYCDFI